MTEFIIKKVLFMTDEEKAEYSNTESDDGDTSSDYQPSHKSDEDECFCSACNDDREDLCEEDIDVRLFPCNNFYTKLGIDYVIARNNLLPDQNMFPLYEKMAEDMMCPSEDWQRQKKTNSLAYTEILKSNDTIIEYL